MALTNNKAALAWIDKMAALTKPDQTIWIDGSEAQLDALRKQAVEEGIIKELDPEKLPG